MYVIIQQIIQTNQNSRTLNPKTRFQHDKNHKIPARLPAGWSLRVLHRIHRTIAGSPNARVRSGEISGKFRLPTAAHKRKTFPNAACGTVLRVHTRFKSERRYTDIDNHIIFFIPFDTTITHTHKKRNTGKSCGACAQYKCILSAETFPAACCAEVFA